ncbi:VOC family protein [Alteromonas sp. KUL49]|uniref:VOC family protein n=1 Tax=Alteromonas sp. KUL49 TaxID=2480798 RepID=UPI00102F114F|nr:VOC family protein [Alteromonas sp. KUL49]TAP41252.1 VOC family protein [Alteromonas sp. KUL49]GEA10306.1 glyoxalase [Alteromonas sp. KUL49]
MSNVGLLNYVEFATKDIDATKAFFGAVFEWEFTDYGPEYTAFSETGLDGGFYYSPTVLKAENGAPLLVFYSKDIDGIKAKVVECGGVIAKDTFAFPGGCRFHFIEPGGNELAVWSDTI